MSRRHRISSKSTDDDRRQRSGLSLLEVILAIAILAAAMGLLGELMRIGGRHATATVNLTKAQMYCESVISEIAAGNIPAQSVGNAPVQIDPEWLYSIDVQDLTLENLIAVRVSVRNASDTTLNPREASLTRWIVDPEYIEQLVASSQVQP